MNNPLQIVLLLQEKRERYSRFEQVTNEMMMLSPDEFQKGMDTREALLNDIKQIDAQITQQCCDNTPLRQVLNAQCDRDGLPEDLAQIYDVSMSVRAIMNRILKNESILQTYIEDQKILILEKIQELNNSSQSVADKYHRSLEGAVEKLPSLDWKRRI